MHRSNEKFKSCYCNVPFDYCLTYVFDFYHTRQTIKCTGECQRVFYITYPDIISTDLINKS